MQVCHKTREYVEHNRDYTLSDFFLSIEYQSLKEILVLPSSHIYYTRTIRESVDVAVDVEVRES